MTFRKALLVPEKLLDARGAVPVWKDGWAQAVSSAPVGVTL